MKEFRNGLQFRVVPTSPQRLGYRHRELVVSPERRSYRTWVNF
jgi:hypothetical protein